MSNCLLCHKEIAESIKMFDLFFIKKPSYQICSTCEVEFQQLDVQKEQCQRCCKESTEAICSDCRYWENKGGIVDHQALYAYNEKMQEYFSCYKFQGDYLLRHVFAKQIREALSVYQGFTFVPVPISDKRLEERGFNQVEGLLDAASLPYQSILRKKHSQRQSELNRAERLQQVHPFFIQETASVPNQILIVDDIYTTGSSLFAAKELLLKEGAKIVKTFSLAR